MKTGDKVVCVDDALPDWAIPLCSARIVNGKTYCVRSVGEWHGEFAVRVVGITCAFHQSGQECGFQPFRFRLLDELKTEASTNRKECVPC